MKQDRYDEFYMLQTQAKALEKKNKGQAALTIYLDILEHYFPDTDFSFKRAIHWLSHQDNQEQKIIEIAHLALTRINNSEMKGDAAYFQKQLDEIAQKSKKSRDRQFFANYHSWLIAALYTLVALILSLPLKIYKFIFIIFFAIVCWLIYEILKRVRKALSVNKQILALLLTSIILAAAAAQIPPPQWTNFFSLAPLAEISQTGAINQMEGPDSANQRTTIRQEDIDTLAQIYQNTLVLDSYQLEVSEDNITLVLYPKASASQSEVKAVAAEIFSELNAIMGYRSYQDRLGDLYKNYHATAKSVDRQGITQLKGKVSRYTLRITW